MIGIHYKILGIIFNFEFKIYIPTSSFSENYLLDDVQ